MSTTGKEQERRRSKARRGHEIGGTLVLLAAAGVLGVISLAVKREKTNYADEVVHDTLQAHRSPVVDLVARPVPLLSLPILVVAATAGLVLWLKQQDRPEAAIAI